MREEQTVSAGGGEGGADATGVGSLIFPSVQVGRVMSAEGEI